MKVMRTIFITILCVWMVGCTSKPKHNPIVDTINNSIGINDTLGLSLRPEYQGCPDIRIPVRYVELPSEEITNDTVLVFNYVDEMPEFPGGNEMLSNFIYDHIRYPDEAEKNGIQGRVIMQVVIDENGRVTRPEVIKHVSSSLDEEALRIVSMMPEWKPGKKNGVEVKVKFTFPVVFRLSEEDVGDTLIAVEE